MTKRRTPTAPVFVVQTHRGLGSFFFIEPSPDQPSGQLTENILSATWFPDGASARKQLKKCNKLNKGYGKAIVDECSVEFIRCMQAAAKRARDVAIARGDIPDPFPMPMRFACVMMVGLAILALLLYWILEPFR